MKTLLYWSLVVSAFGVTPQVNAQATFFEQERFDGRTISVDRRVPNFQRSGFRDGLSSAVVLDERWEVCEETRLQGRCMVLRQGRYPSPGSMGLYGRVVSARIVPANEYIDASRLAPDPMAIYDSRRRGNERLYKVPVTSVRAVMGPPEQRCWIEREAIVMPPRSNTNVPAALAGALIGGILGHQVGGGSGQDIATVGGAVAGAVVGSRLGGRTQDTTAQTQDVQRCSTMPASGVPDHWEATYTFRGQEHRIQTATRPGDTVMVNRRGEPRS